MIVKPTTIESKCYDKGASIQSKVQVTPFMSRIERKYVYCLISTSYLAGLFGIFISLHI